MGSDRQSSGRGPSALEQAARAADPGVLLVEPRLLRKVIKRHFRLGGLGVRVPHDRCLALGRDELFAAVSRDRLGAAAADLPAAVVLLPHPELAEPPATDPAAALAQVWRGLFHARVHQVLEQRLAEGVLTDAAIRGRVHRIGQTEFDEIRLVLRQDEHLLPPYGDRGTYVEFAALYLELRHFRPRALGRIFPSLAHLEQVDAVLAEDIDATAVLAATQPTGAELPAPAGAEPPGEVVAAAPPDAAAEAPEVAAEAVAAAEVGNLVRAAILTLGAERRAVPAARDLARARLAALAARLAETVGLPGPERPEARAEWVAGATDALLDLADAAAGRGGALRPVEARLLQDLQRACTEHDVRTIDVVGWVLALGRRRIVRSLPALQEVRVARHLRAAERKLARVRLPEPERRRVAALVHAARDRADANVRASLAPRLERVFDEVGFVATSVPERVARRKIVSELLDHVVERGTFGLSQLRDAVSRSNCKLPDLSLKELVLGDQLLLLDRRLTDALDGVYRSGDVYMRFLQKLSSVLFGTWLGRQLTRYLIIPVLAAFVILEGLNHLLAPLLTRLVGHKVPLLTRVSFPGAAVFLFLLLHSAPFRHGTLQVLRGLRAVLTAVFWQAPRWLVTRPAIRWLLGSPPIHFLLDWAVKPALLAAPAIALWHVCDVDRRLTNGPLAALGVRAELGTRALEGALLLALAVVYNSRWGRLVEEAAIDGLQRAVHQVQARILPGLVHLVLQAFQGFLEGVERVLYRVDELLRFRRGESLLGRIGKGSFGVVWFFVTYLVRIYVNLLIEPQVNPIKHFPVVTVSHKIILPLTPTFIRALRAPLEPLVGPVIANTVAATTTVLLPGVFGFLVWELKENWKLYRGEGDRPLAPVLIGHHGETLGALLRPGFHSGTVPKLYSKLRRAAWRRDRSVAKHQEAVHHTAEAIKKFVEREWVSLLRTSPRWGGGPVAVGEVELGSNRIRVELQAPAVAPTSAWLVLEEQSGWIVASLGRDRGPTWIDALDDDGRAVLHSSLCGLYQMAGVQLVREQLEAELGPDLPYDVADEGLVLWPEKGYATEVIYDLRRPVRLHPRVRGAPPVVPPPVLDGRRVRFGDRRITWTTWVDAWGEGPGPAVTPCPEVVLLPPRAA